MASCDFKTYGMTGLTDVTNLVCVLAPNALSEKLFVFLWFWYYFLSLVLFINLLLVVALMFKSVAIRKLYASRYIFNKKMPKDGEKFHLKVRNTKSLYP